MKKILIVLFMISMLVNLVALIVACPWINGANAVQNGFRRLSRSGETVGGANDFRLSYADRDCVLAVEPGLGYTFCSLMNDDSAFFRSRLLSENGTRRRYVATASHFFVAWTCHEDGSCEDVVVRCNGREYEIDHGLLEGRQ